MVFDLFFHCVTVKTIFSCVILKYAVPRQIIPGILKLTTSRGQIKAAYALSYFLLLAAKKKAVIVSFRQDT